MTDVERIVKINEMVETCCASWNAHMKEALKNRMAMIWESDTEAESYKVYTEVLGIIAFMNEAYFLSIHESDRLSDFCGDLYYGYC